MNTADHSLTVSGLRIHVVRKRIKNLHVAVYPPAGRVRVAAPLHLSEENVRLAVVTRLPWIRRQRIHFLEQARQSQRRYVTGESHYYRGKRYRLNVVSPTGQKKVWVKNRSTINLGVDERSTTEDRERMMSEWYRAQLKAALALLIEKWQAATGIDVRDWRVKRMKTKWGSCNAAVGRVWLNLELAKKPVHCLEYILLHEMVHMLERKHNDAFVAHMDRFMPNWRARRDELNRSPVAHEDWSY